MSYASDLAAIKLQIIGQLVTHFEASGIPYTCGAVVLREVRPLAEQRVLS